MEHDLKTIEVDFYKYICESCSNPIYAHYKCLKNCPHCGEQCNEKTINNNELESEVIFYSIDPKTAEILIWE